MINRFWRRLKKRLRQRRRWVGLAVVAAAITAAAAWQVVWQGAQQDAVPVWGPSADREAAQDKLRQQTNEQSLERLRISGGRHETEWVKQYVCGSESSVLGRKSIKELAEILQSNPTLELTVPAAGKARVTETIDDLSPDCRGSAQFGLDAEGRLHLYDGSPSEDKVIRTFFQLDVELMESSLPPEAIQELRAGIRIEDMAQYNSVLSTFSDFSVEEAKEVLKAGDQ